MSSVNPAVALGIAIIVVACLLYAALAPSQKKPSFESPTQETLEKGMDAIHVLQKFTRAKESGMLDPSMVARECLRFNKRWEN